MSTSTFTRTMTIEPGYDGRKGSDPKWRTAGMKPNEDYGIHGCTLRFILQGPLGATQFVVYTDWYTPNVQEERNGQMDRNPSRSLRPMGCDVGYHALTPQYDGQEPMDCHIFGGQCYYDGSGLRAHEWVKNILLTKGSDGIWAALEQDYAERFGGVQ